MFGWLWDWEVYTEIPKWDYVLVGEHLKCRRVFRPWRWIRRVFK